MLSLSAKLAITYLLLLDFVFLSSDDTLDADEIVVVGEAVLTIVLLFLFFFAFLTVVARGLLHLFSVFLLLRHAFLIVLSCFCGA